MLEVSDPDNLPHVPDRHRSVGQKVWRDGALPPTEGLYSHVRSQFYSHPFLPRVWAYARKSTLLHLHFKGALMASAVFVYTAWSLPVD